MARMRSQYFWFTKICSISKLTFFSEAKVSVSFPMPSGQYPTGINEIKHLSIILIRLKLLMLGVSPLNIQMLKGKVIPATKL
jgi:hypothetical protein